MSKFEKLKNMLSHRSGVTSPGGLAAYIGRKKYGKNVMKKAAAEHKSAESVKKHGHK